MIRHLIEQRLHAAVAAVLPDADLTSVLVRSCEPKFGDYQTNALMSLAKQRKLNPRQLATDVMAKLDVTGLCEPPEIAGAAFINFRLKAEALAGLLQGAARGEHLFFRKAATPRTIVIDFSSPNVAKPMHVGHIRSTILGDALARAFRLLGHRVVTDNHIGDWGTQFGMLLIGWKRELDAPALAADPIGEMERLYKKLSAECKADPAKLEAARAELVKLQRGDAENLAIWREMQRLSQVQFDTIYARLGVKFDVALGESFYNPRLQATVDDLVAKGLARESEGAKAIFSDDSLPPKDDPFKTQRDGEWHANPALVQKNDGGFNYATTDLATLAYRMETWSPDEIIYVTDGRQQLHFRQIFAAFRRWRADAKVRLEHVWFGSILGEDGKPFKTRSGDTVKLADLLDEAEERALKVVTDKNPNLPEGERREIARIVGLGAVKYADLLPNRQTDYVFSWDKLLALQGNTAPYLQYASTRIQSIFRKATEAGVSLDPSAAIRLGAPEELALAKHLLNFGFVLEMVAEECRPNYLCNYLYELAGHFTRFYEACPVLKAAEPERSTRLRLCELAGRVLRQGLDVLGIGTPEQM
ncbi:MAG: arginine--tRNA ligase [Verrucomicrobia bacterium]|nr:arginine--tRNA ligase [Verrucomicrobiota bacterium]